MHGFIKYSTFATSFLFVSTNAFSVPCTIKANLVTHPGLRLKGIVHDNAASCGTRLFSVSKEQTTEIIDDEVERLKSMAAQLRAEAASLEAEKAQEVADATERAFQKFDVNKDGEISFEELKDGLEKVLKTELEEKRVKTLMDEFDTSGDGALQMDEFVSVDRFRSRLEGIIRDEKAAALEAKKQAKIEKEAAVLAEARANILNDGPPTNKDKVLSTIPYLFPLMDGLLFGRFLLTDTDNPAVQILGLIYTIYRNIPFSGFVTIVAFNLLSANIGINRLIRFNMQQAIYLDIALFIPSLIASIYSLVIKDGVPETITQLGSDAIFVTLIAAIGYSVISSLLGATPDKLPGISNYVNQRMPTIDMLDETGQFIPEDQRKGKEDEDK
eukprot:CAMPEP_0178927946 /NCGR_PEP_ID=MMETSP0786-20121207/19547_1 /TAXON_ID=186022 /ORGANISM="Thalassionema frauenfeldii, Strain CCMP 1798" /LENGTH=384 /DNA_ID=CAMNT_0020603589 /DNA_START=137 /DNA_END=1288 /DNA_ORIENTATION=-